MIVIGLSNWITSFDLSSKERIPRISSFSSPLTHSSTSLMKEIRCVVCGDQGVGKTSIIVNLIKNDFIEVVDHCLPEVVVELDNNLHLIDTSTLNLERELKKSNVICLVYSVADPNNHENIQNWLLYFKSIGINNPIILIGNKIDLDCPSYSLHSDITPIMKQFKQVESCVESSAKLSININEIFYFAQRAVLYPTAPLYDSRLHTLKPASAAALSRIFKLCDSNKDGLLDYTELNAFQIKCFNSPLSDGDLRDITQLVSQHSPQTISTLPDNSIALTQLGFILLHTIFIQRGRLETTWSVLTNFGYAQDLRLKEDFLYPDLHIPPNSSVELSPQGYSFFTEIFEKFDVDKDGALCESELEELFATSPGNPWLNNGFPDTTLTDEKGAVTLQGWLAQWSMTTLLDHKTTLAYLAYLGYEMASAHENATTTSALKTTPPRRRSGDRGALQRNVFLAYIIGAPNAGKTSLLRALLNKPFAGGGSVGSSSGGSVLNAVNAVEMEGGEKYLVAQEVVDFADVAGGSGSVSGKHAKGKPATTHLPHLHKADVLVLAYDCSDATSFAHLTHLNSIHNLDGLDTPCVYVATKSDLDLAQQRSDVQPDVYCRRRALNVPIAVSVQAGETAGLFQYICSVASTPLQALPRQRRGRNVVNALSIALTLGAGSIGILAFLARVYGWRSPTSLLQSTYRGALLWARSWLTHTHTRTKGKLPSGFAGQLQQRGAPIARGQLLCGEERATTANVSRVQSCHNLILHRATANSGTGTTHPTKATKTCGRCTGSGLIAAMAVIPTAGETDLYQAMSTVWLDNRGHNEHFWQHEWNKHGSCYSTLKPACQADSSESGSENVDTMIDYFSRILNTYNRFPTYEFLANRGITPSSTHTYKLADIKHALKEAFGYAPTIKCDGGGNKVHEVWYSFNLEGPLVSGTLLPREQVSADSCSQDVYYLPKHQSRNKHSASAIPLLLILHTSALFLAQFQP
ncbi:hypothetical protein E3P89_00959 [Wallemia ichthyophaga]|uniref:Mitochondrial Rho GTPase 1 n=1 Tax=Wallemia ichthyophaga TaxID=245174 RepID=A0A4T0HJU7_WALIC|nr:hypothetical protein E3P90_01254 [Wallemia ichthyophaga]TIB16268.1 hypothetical protein E3P93_01005 [Wallemia ichthyophaga]TIB24441.1 hypothetical protein E3P89_00959 [Wallemia ichthyophaga]TIB26209.1 hypothetical protein E3P88_01123 [Wallemia ichthyophaga]